MAEQKDKAGEPKGTLQDQHVAEQGPEQPSSAQEWGERHADARAIATGGKDAESNQTRP